MCVVQTEAAVLTPVQLPPQPRPLLDLPAGSHPPPGLQPQLVLPPATEVLSDCSAGPRLAECHAEVVLLQAALCSVSPVLRVVGLQAGPGAQAQLSGVAGGVYTHQPVVAGGVDGPDMAVMIILR